MKIAGVVNLLVAVLVGDTGLRLAASRTRLFHESTGGPAPDPCIAGHGHIFLVFSVYEMCN